MKEFPFPRDHALHPPSLPTEVGRDTPVVQVKLWNGDSAWLLTRYEDVRAGLTDERLSADSTRPGYPSASVASSIARQMLPNFLLMDDPEHRRIRNLFLAEFMPKPIEARRADIRATAEAQVDHLLTCQQPADLMAEFTQPIPALVLSELMGLEASRNAELLAHVVVFLKSDSTLEQATASNQALIAFLDDWVERKLADPGDDMVSRVAARLHDGTVTRLELLGAMRQIFAAGQDSTAANMTMGVLLLLCHPDQLAVLVARDDMTLWGAAVDEIVRFATVTHFGRRRVAREDTVIGGQLIRVGEGVIMAENYANRDATVFEDPDRFDAFRANSGKHIGFGAGTHHCLGANLARAEMQIAIATLFRRVPSLRLAGDIGQLSFRPDMTIYCAERLPVAWG